MDVWCGLLTFKAALTCGHLKSRLYFPWPTWPPLLMAIRSGLWLGPPDLQALRASHSFPLRGVGRAAASWSWKPREPGALLRAGAERRPEPVGAASGAQNPGSKASAAFPDASAEHMPHSSNSFLIHDISLGTVGGSKQALPKTKTTSTTPERRGGDARSRTLPPLSSGNRHLENHFSEGTRCPLRPSYIAPPFSGAEIGLRSICYKDDAGCQSGFD